jgi:predicted GIY-YIG superfamily endonuclease
MNAVYIMASRKHGTLYIGVTSDLLSRVAQHREVPTRWLHQALWRQALGLVRTP